MKIFGCSLILFLFSSACNNNSNNSLLIQSITNELSGDVIGDTIITQFKNIEQKRLSASIYYQGKSKLIDELDIHLSTKYDSSYQKILNYYNLKFDTELKDTLFNTWQTDSTEFILFKNSDSSILVNIFKR